MDELQNQERDQIRERLETALASTYAIERALGEGGMAFVYLANDVKHGRQVAVKVLKPELAASLGAERFLREIRITAKLQHPNILPLYDSGAVDGLLYYVMPFVVGESLSDQVAREKQLSIHDAVQITREVAEALGYAHSYGLVHRDIKPDNIMMSNGHAIVADFGIARAMSEAGADKLTQTGMAVGTPAYMSPEQAAGESDVDGRSDIYSLGCVFYELLVGQVPFTGPNSVAVMARHAMDNVTAPSIMRQSVPPEVEDIVFQSMEKLPADRYRTAHEMVEALKAVERGEVSMPVARASQLAMRQSQMGMRGSRMSMRMSRTGMDPSELGLDAGELQAAPARRWPLLAGIATAAVAALAVTGWLVLGGGETPVPTGGGLDARNVAVLYFQDVSNDASLGHVADGITDGLIEQLGRVEKLSVVSRNAVAAFRDATLAYDSIGRALQVGSIVLGSVGMAGRDLTVTVRLVDGNSGADLGVGGRGSFRMPAADPLAARDSAVGLAAALLRQRIGEEVRMRETQAETRSVQAWTLLQRAVRERGEAAGLTAEAAGARLAEADSLLRLAAAADPAWPEPLIQRGWVALDRARRTRGPAAAPQYDAAIAHAGEALAASPGNARALELRGTARFRYYEAKLTDNPITWNRLKTDAREDLEAAVGADPGLASAHLTLSVLYYAFDDVGSALIAAQRALSADAYLERADDVMERIFFGSLDRGDFANAERWCLRGAARFPQDPRFVTCRLFLLVTPEFPPDVAGGWQLVARLDTLAATPFARAQARVLMGGVLARAELRDSARSVWRRTRQEATSDVDPGLILPALEAYTRTLAEDWDEAIELLKRAVAANPDHDFAGTAGQYWWWEKLRQQPRWREIKRTP
jgi:serine/threonine-protein kinase